MNLQDAINEICIKLEAIDCTIAKDSDYESHTCGECGYMISPHYCRKLSYEICGLDIYPACPDFVLRREEHPR